MKICQIFSKFDTIIPFLGKFVGPNIPIYVPPP